MSATKLLLRTTPQGLQRLVLVTDARDARSLVLERLGHDALGEPAWLLEAVVRLRLSDVSSSAENDMLDLLVRELEAV